MPNNTSGMPVDPIPQAAPPREREKFAHRQRVDVADAARVEIAGARMVDRVRAPPEIVGRKRQNADNAANPIVRAAAREERAVAAVVLNHEEANQKPGRRDCDE